jgi:hypothetical protein
VERRGILSDSFEPAVLLLLEEIAKDPQASLLRIPKKPLREFAPGSEEVLSPHGSHLTLAEKHLVQAYREEAAWVLLQACIARLKEDPGIHSPFDPDPDGLRKVAHRLRERLEPEGQPPEALRAVAEGASRSPTDLAVASIRLAPSEVAYNCLALSHQQEGHVEASVQVLGRFFRGTSTNGAKAAACANMARAWEKQGKLEQALRSNLKACSFEPAETVFLVWALASALQVGEESTAIGCAKRLDEQEPADSVGRAIHGLRLGRAMGSWCPTSAGLRLAARIRGLGSERSEAVCEAFA